MNGYEYANDCLQQLKQKRRKATGNSFVEHGCLQEWVDAINGQQAAGGQSGQCRQRVGLIAQPISGLAWPGAPATGTTAAFASQLSPL